MIMSNFDFFLSFDLVASLSQLTQVVTSRGVMVSKLD